MAKKTAPKKPARKRATRKPANGLSEQEHGQGWERGEASTFELDESEPPTTNGDDEDDEDDIDPEDE